MYNFGYQSFSAGSLHKPYFTSPITRLPKPHFKNNHSNETEQVRKSIEDMEMYPKQFTQLLKNEERNIRSFKSRIGKEKERINQDVSAWRVEFNHNVEDLRLSLHAELDRIYQNYLERYAQFKGELLEINRLKEQMEIEVARNKTMPRKNMTRSEKKLQFSNVQTISNMEKSNYDLRKTHLMNYISELQKERIPPLKEYLRQITAMTQYDKGFYQADSFQKFLEKLKQQLSGDLRAVYKAKSQFIKDVDSLTLKDGQKILDVVLENTKTQDKDISSLPVTQIISPKKTYLSSQTGLIGPSQQGVKFQWAEQLKLIENRRIKCLDPILCGTVLNDTLVFGSKSGKIHLYGKDGSQLGILKQHKAGICTLGRVQIHGKEHLMSGSDHGCSTVIIWNIQTKEVICKFNQHSAAVTALIDLQDSAHILSGSYDKKLNIYNITTQSLSYNLPTNKTSITGAILNTSHNKLITCGLDKTLSVWEVHRNEEQVETISLMRKIQSGCLICSLVASQLLEDIVVIGDKEGKVKIVNVVTGQVERTINCSSNYLIQLILIERIAKPNYPIVLAWPYKEQRILLINSESQRIEAKPTKGYLEFGCGVSPKCFLSDGGNVLWMVSHSQAQFDIISCRVDSL